MLHDAVVARRVLAGEASTFAARPDVRSVDTVYDKAGRADSSDLSGKAARVLGGTGCVQGRRYGLSWGSYGTGGRRGVC